MIQRWRACWLMSLVCGGARPGLGVGRTICLDRQALQRGLGMGLIRGCGVLRHGVLRGVWKLQVGRGGKLRGWDRVR